jgi:hypothetical protein
MDDYLIVSSGMSEYAHSKRFLELHEKTQVYSVQTTNGREFIGDYVCLHHNVNKKMVNVLQSIKKVTAYF